MLRYWRRSSLQSETMKQSTKMNIKVFCALLLLVSFFLPLARGCSQLELPGGAEKSKPWITLEIKSPKTVYAYEVIFDDAMSGWDSFFFLFFGYLWPVPIILFNMFLKKKWILNIVMITEILLCLSSAYLITMLTLFSSKLLVGWYTAITACLIYFCLSAYGIVRNVIDHYRQKSA